MTDPAALFGAVLGTYLVAHHVADYWVQTSDQAALVTVGH